MGNLYLPFKGQELLPSNSGQSIFVNCPSLASPAHKGNRLYKGGDPKEIITTIEIEQRVTDFDNQ